MTRLFSGTAIAFAGALAVAPIVALAQDLTDLSTEERSALHEEFRAYLLENPEILLEAMQILEDRQATAQADADKLLLQQLTSEIQNDGRSWEGGNPDGDVVMVEFLDYRCGYCKRAHDDVAELISSDGNIRFIVKEFPILGQGSLLASQFAIATRMEAGDDAYKAVHDALMKLRQEPSEEALRQIALDQGLDADAVLARMEDPEIVAELRANRALAEQLSIQGTPSFIIGDEFVRGYVTLSAMREIVAEQRDAS
ncbi:MAG: DsbA family protein [Pseudomonadota bacterium]